MKLTETSKTVKTVIGGLSSVVIALAGVIGWLLFTFETTSAAEQKWAEHNQAIACRTVYELEERRRQYLERLRFDGALTEKDRQWIQQELDVLEKKIKRIDPQGRC